MPEPTREAEPAGVHRALSDLGGRDAVGSTLPVGFRATSSAGSFSLVVTSRPIWGFIVLLTALLMDAMLYVMGTLVAQSRAWREAWPAIPFVLIGVGMTYIGLRAVLNRIETTVGDGVIRVQHRPLPWFGPGPIRQDDIDQLYIVEDRSLQMNHRTVVRYALQLLTRSGETHELFIVDKLEQARFIEREIERALGIVDRPMDDEVKKP